MPITPKTGSLFHADSQSSAWCWKSRRRAARRTPQAYRAGAAGAARPPGTGQRAHPVARRRRLEQPGGDVRGRTPWPALSAQATPCTPVSNGRCWKAIWQNAGSSWQGRVGRGRVAGLGAGSAASCWCAGVCDTPCENANPLSNCRI